VAAPEALEAAAAYIEATLTGLGYEVMEHWFRDQGHEYRNLLATLPGSALPQERVLVVGHYDTVAESPGADDNASGVAALLELARVSRGLEFERTVQFVAVNLEESARPRSEDRGATFWGLRGSQALARHARIEGWNIRGAAVLESIAYAGPEIEQRMPAGLPIQAPDRGDFVAVVGNEASAEIVGAYVAAIEQFRIPLPVVPQLAPGRGEEMPHVRRSDHAAFWDAGYPAFMLTDTANFRNPHYHQPTDTLETLNLEFATAVCQATGGWVALVALGSWSGAPSPHR
jgi:Zn-dependent M28 family amino/carboxypeptidase